MSIVTALCAFAMPTAQEPTDWQSERLALLAKSVSNLESLADWCNGNEVFVERDRLFNVILRIDPDNYRAHKGLKHVQMRDGKWVPPEKVVVSKNFNPGMAAKFPERMRTTLQPTCDGLLELVDRFKLEGLDRDVVYTDVLGFDPDHARVHAERGETKVGEAWVLRETAAAKERRPELKSLVRAVIADAPKVEDFEPGEADRALGVAWTVAVRTPIVRVVSTGGRDDAVKLATYASATAGLFRELFDAKVVEKLQMTIYVVSSPEERKRFLENHPSIKPEERAGLEKMISIGLNIAGDFLLFTSNAEQRLDTVVRQTLSHLLVCGLGVAPDRGWAFEGFGMYLTRELTGTRMTWYTLPSKADPAQRELRNRLVASKANWMNDAHEMLEGPRKPDLREMLTKDVDALSIEDLLYSYVLAAYVLEARAPDAAKILRGLGSDEAPETVLATTLGFDLATTDRRVRRWLSERK
ncbi:MAG: hypothetical protein K8S98_17345 [Planctomycetes bacterium]|nr:hypothetical protein [Planctomycetota bacterium]